MATSRKLFRQGGVGFIGRLDGTPPNRAKVRDFAKPRFMFLPAHNARGSRLVGRAAKPNVPASRHNGLRPRNNHGRRGHNSHNTIHIRPRNNHGRRDHNSRNTVHIQGVRRNTRNTHRIRLNRA